VIGHKPVDSYEFFVTAKDGFASFPDSLVNLKNNQTIKAKYAKMSVLVPYSKPEVSAMFFVFITIVVLILLIASVRIPIHFYKLIGLIKKEFIFEQKSIRLLRWLGLELLVVYFLSLLGSYFGHQFDCSLFAFSEYELVMESVDPIWLLLGIVTFLIAEILSKALVIKEEQELTI
jgi:membrane protease YdiL (CAAX protease family)